jgi:hypothetical protein
MDFKDLSVNPPYSLLKEHRMRGLKSGGPQMVVGVLVVLGAAFCLVPGGIVRGSDQAKDFSRASVESFKLGEGKQLGDGPAKENSGIVKSRQWNDVYWMQNDSGDEPRIYAVHRDGSVYQCERYPDVPGVLIGDAINVDWEDIAVDAAGHVIVADCGNGANDRRDLVLYYVAEPAPDAGRTSTLRRIFVRYPEQRDFPASKDDFNYDCEAIFTLADDVYLCTKHRSDNMTRVYRLDLSDGDEVHALQLIDKFDVRGQVTGADASPDGRHLVLTTYEALWLFDVTDPQRPLSGPVRWLPYADETEIEAVCFADDETLLVGDEDAARLYEVPIKRFVGFTP